MDNYILSFTTSQIPFIEHNDAIRCQMASNHIRQSLNVKNSELPYVMTGFENLKEVQELNRINNNFYCLAKDNGRVIYKNDEHMLVHYDSGDFDIFKKTSTNDFTNNSTFNKNDLIVQDRSVNHGIIHNGINIKTGIMPYYGYNYQDSIIISENIKNKYTSYHDEEISLQINEDQIIIESDILFEDKKFLKKGESILSYKKINYNNISDFFGNISNYISDKNYKVNYINIYINNFNMYKRNNEIKLLKEIYKLEKIKERILNTNEDIDKNKLSKYLYYLGLESFTYLKKYKISNNIKFNGIMINIGVSYKKPLEIGDKMANRHGNKGIISKIEKIENMPHTKDGEPLDIVINPLGIISRMNIGQIYELHASYCVYNFKKKLKKLHENKLDGVAKKEILQFIKLFDNTENNWYYNQTKDQLSSIKELNDEFIDNFYLLAYPFTTTFESVENIMKYTDTKYEEEVYDPMDKSYKQIAVGYMYWFKLYHLVSEKTSARSIGKYKKKTHQPVKGRTNKGGQRFGEMEVWDLVAYNMPNNIREFLTLKSDDFKKKYNYVNNIINDLDIDLNSIEGETETYKVFKSYMKMLGLEIIDDKK